MARQRQRERERVWAWERERERERAWQTERERERSHPCVGTSRSQNVPGALGLIKLRHEDSLEAGLHHEFLCRVTALCFAVTTLGFAAADG